MNAYGLLDEFAMSMGSAAAKKYKYFRKSVESKRVSDLLTEMSVDVPKIDGEGYYTVDIVVEGKTEEAAFKVAQWKGNEYPTIIYHHGAAEGSYDFSFNRILAKKKSDIQANLIGIQALFNHSNKEFMESIAYLSNYMEMLAGSVLLIEGLIEQIRQISDQKIVVTGTSLGGFVTNLHFAYYNTADLYKPMLAGARIGDVFVDSAYSKMTSDNGKANAETLHDVLDFWNDVRNKNQDNLFVLLAKYDQLIKYDVHRVDFDAEHVTIIPYGHSTGATKFKRLREHVLSGLNV